jgi:magnesium chelatase family protein
LDRIDLHIEVPAVAYKELRGRGHRRHLGRYTCACGSLARHSTTVWLLQRTHLLAALAEYLRIDDAGERTLEMAERRMGKCPCTRRILKVARTIADLGGSEAITAKHLAEAVQYRSLDRSYWS